MGARRQLSHTDQNLWFLIVAYPLARPRDCGGASWSDFSMAGATACIAELAANSSHSRSNLAPTTLAARNLVRHISGAIFVLELGTMYWHDG